MEKGSVEEQRDQTRLLGSGTTLISTDAAIVAYNDNHSVDPAAHVAAIANIVLRKGYWIEEEGILNQNGTEERKWLKDHCLNDEARCNGSIDSNLNTYLGLGNAIRIFKRPINGKLLDEFVKDKQITISRDIFIKIVGDSLKSDELEAFFYMCEQDGILIMNGKKECKAQLDKLNKLIITADQKSNLGRLSYFIGRRRRKLIVDLLMKSGGALFINKADALAIEADLL